jgi:O-antigen ligase
MTLRHYVRSAKNGKADANRKIVSLAAATVGAGGGWIVCAFIIGVALILTGSRGGVGATIGGILAFVLLTGFRGPKNAVGLGFSLLALGLVIGAAFFNYGDFLGERIATFGFGSDDRIAVYEVTWRSIADAPWFGSGDGAFEEVFAMYRDNSVSREGVWNKAHNSYLESFQGLGIPVTALLIAGVASVAGRCVYAALTRRKSTTAPLAASGATVVIFLHSFVDFSLQIQAVALTWVALLGAGVAQSWSSQTATDQAKSSQRFFRGWALNGENSPRDRFDRPATDMSATFSASTRLTRLGSQRPGKRRSVLD